MGKSYKDINKQPKKLNSKNSLLRIREEEEDDIKEYTGMSFSMILKKQEEN